jgi:hypothetical protein
MFRKLIALALLAGGIAALVKKQGEAQSAPSPAPATPEPTPASEPTADAIQPAEASEPAAEDEIDEDLAEVRSGQTEDTIESPVIDADGDEAVIPDVSDDDPLVRQEEDAAAAAAGSIGGGDAEPLPPDLDPELQPVVEASGDEPETLEKELEEEGR